MNTYLKRKELFMKKRDILFLLCMIFLVGCSNQNDKPETPVLEERAETEISIIVEEETTDNNIPQVEPSAPTKEEVLAMREKVLDGMTNDDKERLIENIKVANLQMEQAYLNDSIFDKLEDKDSLAWNYFDKKGDIQVGWAYDSNKKTVMTEEGITESEFYQKYGEPIMVYNRFDGANFVELIQDMQKSVHNDQLSADLQQLIDLTNLATETHEMKYANDIYKILHDMDYFLLRYGIEDVGKYTKDKGVVATYYGVLNVYQDKTKGENESESISLSDNESIEKINKYMISEQSFDVSLNDWGDVTFVSCKPPHDSIFEDASFFLVNDEQILYKFPYRFEENNTMGYVGLFDSVGAVAFEDINNDKKEDIIIITYYVTGAGPTGMVPRPSPRIFLAGKNEFYLAMDMIKDIEEHITEKNMTIENIYNYLQN